VNSRGRGWLRSAPFSVLKEFQNGKTQGWSRWHRHSGDQQVHGGHVIPTPCGQITTHNAALAATTSVGFTVTNAYIDADDTVNVSMASGGTASSYVYVVDAVAAGSFVIHIRNVSGGSLGEAIVLNYSIIKNYF
jgi:hypothetical protein